ncbi:2-dehydropantoate 2-reductase [Bacillaceae bacterium S4-13-58]
MKIGVIGGGALGLLVSGFLALHSHNVTLYCRREDQQKNIDKNGIYIESAVQANFNVRVSTGIFPHIQEEELFIVATKQNAIHDVMKVLSKKLRSGQGVLFLQNGMSHIQWFDCIPTTVYVGTVEHGAKKVSDTQVVHTGNGQINIAIWKGNKDLLGLSARLHHDTFPFIWKEDGQALLKWKLIVNAVINPITALFKVKNGTILNNAYLLKMAYDLCQEASGVLRLPFDDAWKYVQQICQRTSENESSMLKDILNGRQTEIDAISGFIIDEADDQPIPYTLFVYQSIKALEEEEKRNG